LQSGHVSSDPVDTMNAVSGKTSALKSLLISSEYYPPDVGGISQYMSSMVSALGPDRVCCLTGVRAQVDRQKKKPAAGVYRRPLAFAKPKYLQAVGWAAAVSEIVVRERPQAVQLATLYEGPFGLWMRKWMRMPYVVYAHGNEVLDAIRTDWDGLRLAIRNADCVLANSRFTASLLKQVGVESERIEIVHPGCDVARFQPTSISDDFRKAILGSHAAGKIILTVGRLVPRKGHDMMIRALPRVLKNIPDACYLIVGSGPAKPMLEELTFSMGVQGNVIFLENVGDAELPSVYGMCDVFVMPSRADLKACDVEGFGIVYLEANACGKPVIAGKSGGIADAVVDGETGLLVPPDSPETLAESTCRVLTHKEYAERLGQQGRERAIREFSWDGIADHVDRIMIAVASGKYGPASNS
jgi:phosphatidylinositol alpha-1,6-mannosyltransferase